MLHCTTCGAALPLEGANFCSACGRPQPPSGAKNDPRSSRTSKVHDAWSDNKTVVAGSIPMLHVQDGLASRTITLVNDEISIGRAADCAVVIPNQSVSGHHARLVRSEQGHRIVDAGSANGLFFRGECIKERTLTDGDVLRIPDPHAGSFVTLTYLNAAVPREPDADATPRRFPTPVDVPRIDIGRAGADIALDHPLVSRVHARLERNASGLTVRDLRSTNGTWLNGVRVDRPTLLQPGDVVQVGPFRLEYTGDALEEPRHEPGIWIDARNLRRTVATRLGRERRTILRDVSLSIRPREFVALVGGSGAGKSTLLQALAGFVRAEQGNVHVNGDDFYAHFDAYRSGIGYVPQDDIVHRSLAVGRALRYAAKLRLPSDTRSSEIERRVDGVLDAVDMEAHRNSTIDHLSGGQRKRVSIACELLSEPSLLFLDEPTSGLDPHLERRMMFTLRRLADAGRTVVLVTHATANIMVCDHVAFMAAGRMVYFGPPAEALEFFRVSNGDFAEIYARLEGTAEPDAAIVRDVLADEYAAWKKASRDANAQPLLAELWEARYKKSQQHQRYVRDRLDRHRDLPLTREMERPTRASARSTSSLTQFAVLVRRYIDLMFSDFRNLAILLLQAPLIAGLLCLVSERTVLSARVGPYEAKKLLFMLSTVGVWFGIINAAREICKEDSVLRRERFASLSVGPYVASKFVVLSGLVFVQSALLLAVLNLKVQFPAEGVLSRALWPEADTSSVTFAVVGELFATCSLSGIAGLAIGLLISSIATTPDKAISAVPLALIPQILFAGLLFQLQGPTTVLSWLTASRWAMDSYGASVNLNAFRWTTDQLVVAEPQYESTLASLATSWSMLLLYALVCGLAVYAQVRRRA